MQPSSNISTSLLSILTVIVMLLGSLCGTLPAGTLTAPVSVEISVGVEGDLGVTGSEEAVKVADTLMDVLSHSSLRLSADGSCAQLALNVKDKQVASVAMKEDGDSLVVVSDFFPKTKLTIDKATYSQMMQQALGSAGAPENPFSALQEGPDPAALAAAVQGPLEEVLEGIRSRFGETETGVFVIEGTVYTGKSVCDITLKEAAELVLPALKKILEDENVVSLLSVFGQKVDPAAMDEALKNVRNSDGSDMPSLSIVKYSNDAGETCLEIIMDRDGEKITLIHSVSGQVSVTRLFTDMSHGDNAKVVMYADKEKGLYDLKMNMVTGGNSGEASVTLQQIEGGVRLDLSVTAPNSRTGKPLTVRLQTVVNQQAPEFIAEDGWETVRFETLMQDEKAASEFNGKITAGLLKVVALVAVQYPDIMPVLMKMLPISK